MCRYLFQIRIIFPGLFIGYLLLTADDVPGQTYNLQGSTVAIGNDCYRITPDIPWHNGTVWYTKKINVTTSFDLEFTMNFGNRDNLGADGMVFVMQTKGNSAIGEAGQGIGFRGFSPSLGIEFDTFQNDVENDPAYDHIAVLQNGSVNHALSALSAAVQASATSENIEDGADHLVRIKWLAPQQTLEVYFDCQKRISTRVNMRSIFGNQTEVFWGFTGATGGSSNEQTVCLKKDIVARDTFEICRGEALQLVARNSPNENYVWTPAAFVDNPTIRNPTVRPEKDQLFVVDYLDFCNNPTRDSIFVKVPTLPGLELGNDTSICTNEAFLLRPVLSDPSLPVRFEWSTGAETQELPISVSDTYQLTLRAGNCTVTDSVYVEIKPMPDLPAAYRPATICYFGQPKELRSLFTDPTFTRQWPHSGETTAAVVATAPGRYEVVTTHPSGCEVSEFFDFSDECGLPVWIPEVFSPNGDGHNDLLAPVAPEAIDAHFWVFDRWGAVVYYGEGAPTVWNGQFRGTDCPQGVYAWKIRYKSQRKPSEDYHEKTGSVLLIR